MQKQLIAQQSILFEGKIYNPGEHLPAHNAAMVAAWLEAGTAVWIENKNEAPKAKPRTAEPGLSGVSVASESEDGEDLVGKVPKTTARKKK